MVILMFGAMAAWVRANRPAMAQIDERAHERSALEIQYVASERHPLWGAETKRRRRGHVRLKDAPQASPAPRGDSNGRPSIRRNDPGFFRTHVDADSSV